MKHSFILRKPNANSETLILFSCFFSSEKKQFKYSTQQSILPSNWDFNDNRPIRKGKNIDQNYQVIQKVLNKFTDEFIKIENLLKLNDTEFTSSVLKDHFDIVFKKTKKKDDFFTVLEKFIEEKRSTKIWKPATVTRYNNLKFLIHEYQKSRKVTLNFKLINKAFYNDFLDFCYQERDHYSNTIHRNIGLLKTFLGWALANKYTYVNEFKEFKKPTKVPTREEALNLNHIKYIYNMFLNDEKLQKSRDLFVFQCLTGMRYGELKKVNIRNVIDDDHIILKEEKDFAKPSRTIPLVNISLEILKKYNYKLPILSNQHQNENIKEILKIAGFDDEVEFTRNKGVEQVTFIKKYYERISTHSARRSFITIMRNKGVADKTIMSISGHTDIRSFNIYHQVDDLAKKDAVQKIFSNF